MKNNMSLFKILLCPLVTLLIMMLIGCSTDLGPVNERLDKLEAEVTDLRSAVKALQDAYLDGKIVKSVLPYSAGQGGWVITFSDDTSIILMTDLNTLLFSTLMLHLWRVILMTATIFSSTFNEKAYIGLYNCLSNCAR
jgi:hypothetical protein